MPVQDSDIQTIEMNCPVCTSDKTHVTQKVLEIPHFSEVWLFHLNCKNCGFKHNDMINLAINKPMRYIYHAENKDDYTSKVVRSANGTIRFPKLGVIIEPGPSADGFINNIEGILQDIKNKAKFLLRDAETEQKVQQIMEYITLVDSYIEENKSIDIIIEDPLGNSFILPFDESKMEKKELSDEEAQKLKMGLIIFPQTQ